MHLVERLQQARRIGLADPEKTSPDIAGHFPFLGRMRNRIAIACVGMAPAPALAANSGAS
jgi:hypothetical protein